jgi:hypothetical protein
VKPPPPSITEDSWRSLCAPAPVRPSLVAAGRARLAGNDWPEPLAVADALLAWSPRLFLALV